MAREHEYTSLIEWTGNRGEGTTGFKSFDSTWDISTPGRTVIHCSTPPSFGGDRNKPNPEDLLLSALSACHMLWYLHLAVKAGIVVQSYQDNPVGYSEVDSSGIGRFDRAVLRPQIEVGEGTDLEKADSIHQEIHKYCFIARSVNFPVTYEASYIEQ